MRIYIICPVRGGTPKDVEEYVKKMESEGHSIHFPPRDVDQHDPTGWNICTSHREAMKQCDQVHLFWDIDSKGSHFDLGMAWALGIPVRLIRSYAIDVAGKSYLNFIREWEKRVFGETGS